MPVDAYLAREPRERYVDVERRLRELAVGPRGDHAGDVLLLARNGNEADAQEPILLLGAVPRLARQPEPHRLRDPVDPRASAECDAELAARMRAITGERVEATEIAGLIEALVLEKP